MSSTTYVSDDSATLVGKGPVILLSVIAGLSEPPPAGMTTIDFHNVDSAGATLNAANRKLRIAIGGTDNTFSHTFDGVVFPKGLVVKSSNSLHINVEFD